MGRAKRGTIFEEKSGIGLAGGAQLIEMPSGHVLAQDFDGFGTLTFGSAHGGLGDLYIDELSLDEPTTFERVHRFNP
jgi:hypothetical protein